MGASLTILSPTHNRPEVLALVWRSWLQQEGVEEIVVVNDGSTVSYDEVFSEIAAACVAKGIRFKVLELPLRAGAPAAKNVGISECHCEEILTTDDDILLPPDMVARCRAARPLTGNPVLVGPRVIYLRDGESQNDGLKRASKDAQAYFDMKKLVLCAWAHPGGVREYPFVTAVVIWPSRLFREGLRFFEGYGGNGYREESDPQLRAAIDFGAKVYLTPDAHCFHLPPQIAYAKRAGQRRGGLIWFEYWVLRNNFVFLRRFSPHLEKTFAIQPWRAWLYLLFARLSPKRFAKLLPVAKRN